jgi:hypothetical protein
MRTYTLTRPAYGKDSGATISLQPDDPLVALNVQSGILVEGKTDAAEAEKMTCPICKETMKRPTKLDNADDLAAHYEDKHAGFVVPTWQADTEEDDQA